MIWTCSKLVMEEWLMMNTVSICVQQYCIVVKSSFFLVTHFSMWAILKSPLILGNDVTNMVLLLYRNNLVAYTPSSPTTRCLSLPTMLSSPWIKMAAVLLVVSGSKLFLAAAICLCGKVVYETSKKSDVFPLPFINFILVALSLSLFSIPVQNHKQLISWWRTYL